MRSRGGAGTADIAYELPLRHARADGDARGVSAKVQIACHKVAGMLDFKRVAASAAPALERHDAVGHRVYGRAGRGCVVDAQMRAVDLMHGVQARLGELGAYARVFERRFKHLLAQRLAVGLPVFELAVLLEGYGVIGLAGVVEARPPDLSYADAYGVDILLVVYDREAVALLYAEEVDRPLVYVVQLGGQSVWHVVLHDRAPERRRYGGRMFAPDGGHVARARGYTHRVAVEGEDHVVDRIAVVDHVVETAHGVSLLVQEHRVAVAGAYLPQRKYLGGSLVQTVDLCGRYAV